MFQILRPRSRAGWKGFGEAYVTRWRGQVETDRAGRVVAAPACYGLPHPGGVCPLGIWHRVEYIGGPNKVVDGWYANELNLAMGSPAASPVISFISAGTGAAATSGTETGLGAEVWRGAITNRTRNSPTEASVNFFIPQGVVNAYLHEFGAWAGAASSTPGSGLLVARWTQDYEVDVLTSVDGLWTLSKA